MDTQETLKNKIENLNKNQELFRVESDRISNVSSKKIKDIYDAAFFDPEYTIKDHSWGIVGLVLFILINLGLVYLFFNDLLIFINLLF